MTVRQSLSTDKGLLERANRIVLMPPRNRAVFYHGDEGARLSFLFVRRHPGYVRIDELLQRTHEGRGLVAALGHQPWKHKKEIWWALSRKLALAASGDVHCFGPERLIRDQSLDAHRSKFEARKFTDTTFEKVELPELWNSVKVETIYYNDVPFK